MSAKAADLPASVARSASSAGRETAYDGLGGRDVHRRRKHVVRRLAPIDVVVRVDETAFAARPAEKLRGAIGEDLVDVHVGLRARARLPDGEWKFAGVPSGERFVPPQRRSRRLSVAAARRAPR
jgi:hypothetical protein